MAVDNLFVSGHPLVQHKLTKLRDRQTPTKIFKELVDEIAQFEDAYRLCFVRGPEGIIVSLAERIG